VVENVLDFTSGRVIVVNDFEGVCDVMQAERRHVWLFNIALDRKESCVHDVC